MFHKRATSSAAEENDLENGKLPEGDWGNAVGLEDIGGGGTCSGEKNPKPRQGRLSGRFGKKTAARRQR